jgi:hypothetical protein
VELLHKRGGGTHLESNDCARRDTRSIIHHQTLRTTTVQGNDDDTSAKAYNVNSLSQHCGIVRTRVKF